MNVQDDSGYICSKELGSLLRTLGYNPTESEVFKLMAEVDVDHNGKVGLEYLQWTAGHKPNHIRGLLDYWDISWTYPYS